MPRLARLDAPGVLHHVMGRGIERRNIFRNNRDRNDFIDRLSKLAREGAMEIYYKSIVCQKDIYLKELVRYIHLNLLRAGLVKNLKELNRSQWSGHSALVGKVKREWQNTEYVLSFFGDPEHATKGYKEYVEAGMEQGMRPELVGGGLIRSMGGWPAVLASRRRDGLVSGNLVIPGLISQDILALRILA